MTGEVFIKNMLKIICLFSVSLFDLNVFALEETYFKDKKLDVPYREMGIIISKDGFFPNRIVVYKGEKVRFFVTSAGVESACFNIPDKNVFTTSGKDKIAESEVYFDKVGIFQFNCPNNTFTGRVMVLEKASDRLESERRGLASDMVKIWKPKETPSEWVQIKREDFKEDYIDLDRDRLDPNDSKFSPKNQERETIGFGGRDLAMEK